MQPSLNSLLPAPEMVEVPELDEQESLVLVSKLVALDAGVPQPTSSQDGYLFLSELVNSKGCLTETGIECPRLLQRTGKYNQVMAPLALRPQWAAEKQTIHTAVDLLKTPA